MISPACAGGVCGSLVLWTAPLIAHNGEFVVMIGLVVDGEPVVGVVYQPINDVLYGAARGSGAFVEEFGERTALQVSGNSDLRKFRLVVSRSHRPALLDAIIAAMGLQRERSLGSVGLKIGLIARQQADFYVHPNPGTKEWDTCTPDVILREAGGLMSDCWGRALRYNQPDIIRRFGVLASNSVCHPQISQIVAQVLDDAGVKIASSAFEHASADDAARLVEATTLEWTCWRLMRRNVRSLHAPRRPRSSSGK